MTNPTTARIKKITNKIHAIWVAAPAIPLKPNTPAIKPMIKKVSAQLSMLKPSLVGTWTNSALTPGNAMQKIYFIVIVSHAARQNPRSQSGVH